MKKIFITALLFCSLVNFAQDRQFTYTYQSNVLAKGQKELEVWSTMRNIRNNYYRGIDHRFEFEVGFGAKLQTAFYLNYGYSTAVENNNNLDLIVDKTSFSFANEWKLKLSDPVANAFGSAIYFEYKIGSEEIELESKLIFDKQIGKTVQAFNITHEFEMEKEFSQVGNSIEVENERENKLDLNYGLAYKLNENLAFGCEAMNHNIFDNGEWEQSIFSAGLGLSYNFEGFWVNLTCMPQITNFKTGNLELSENEKVKTRLIFSYVF